MLYFYWGTEKLNSYVQFKIASKATRLENIIVTSKLTSRAYGVPRVKVSGSL